MSDFATRLKACRERHKLSQAELEALAELPATAISHFENGGRLPSFGTLSKLVKALGISADYLLGTSDPANVEPAKGRQKLLEDIARVVKAHTATVWVLTQELNLYDQHGEYFVAVYSDKPSAQQLLKYVPAEYVDHVLAGGGRRNDEDQWFFLREIAPE